ncbi:MAG: putative phosphoribosyl transferase [Solirubrobacteraceae bacterium]|nr:putative phosphoribosyl transferase [Solirubrobacteraceae bacterium]
MRGMGPSCTGTPSQQTAPHPQRPVVIPAGDVRLAGDLTLPAGARGVVVFAHGSGSGRFSPRNRAVAGVLAASGLATLLMDLLTEQEEALDLRTRHLRFDIGLLAGRVVATVDWLASEPMTSALPAGTFGASTGAAAALIAAAERPERVRAVVSRGGRPDLAGDALRRVRAPTLLIVGGNDPEVLRLNEQALARLAGEARLEIVPGAGHLFEEPGALELVALLARDWFVRHLGGRP